MSRVVAYNKTAGAYLSGRRHYAKWKLSLQTANVYRDVGSARVQAENVTGIHDVIEYLPVSIALNSTPTA